MLIQISMCPQSFRSFDYLGRWRTQRS